MRIKSSFQAMSQPFNQGLRLSDSPSGDPSARAIASLRGYAYQLYASGLAWLELRPSQELYLEVAQDYAVATQEALRAVQVKDTTARVTINSEGVRHALDGFVDLVERNSCREVSSSLSFNKRDRAGAGARAPREWRTHVSLLAPRGGRCPYPAAAARADKSRSVGSRSLFYRCARRYGSSGRILASYPLGLRPITHRRPPARIGKWPSALSR